MKNWWLKLYTIPALKKLMLANALIVGFDIIVSFFGIDEAEFVALAYFTPFFFVWIVEVNSGMVRNLPFHKMTMPFPDIRKALLCHYGILIPTVITIQLCICAASEAFGGAAKNLASVPLPTTFLGLLFFLVVCSSLLLALSKPFTEVLYRLKKGNFIINFLFSMMLGTVFMFLLTVIMVVTNIGPEIAMFVAGLGIMGACATYKWRGMFHFVPKQLSKKSLLKYNVVGTLASFMVYFLLAFIGRGEHLDLDLTPQERAVRLTLWRPMIDSIDLATFQDLEPHIGPLEIQDFYKMAPKSIGSIPIERFIDAKNPHRVQFFIIYGKPSPKNFQAMASHLIRHKDKWQKIDPKNHTGLLLAKMWPKGVEAPEGFAEFRVKREVASNKPTKISNTKSQQFDSVD